MRAALKLATGSEAVVLANDVESATERGSSLLRFITCGSVDDGKSTLIGRLLFDAGAVPDDVKEAMIADSARIGAAGGALDYALLVDGLSAEREQGITIDVAYRYFATERRSFIVADTPGHVQYTRNMATGASNAEAALILIDARKGVLAQTRRHSLICSLVGVRRVIGCVNKIDLIDYDEARFRSIEADFREAVADLGFVDVDVVPVSAREGDNISTRSLRTPWHAGPALLAMLEGMPAESGADGAGFALPVQWVNRPDQNFRGFTGMIATGVVRPGEAVTALPSGAQAVVARIVTFDGDLAEARAGQSVTLTLDREIDAPRGEVLVGAGAALRAVQDLYARLLVTAEGAVKLGDSFVARLGSMTVNARVDEIANGVDIETFEERAVSQLAMNDLGLVRLRFEAPVVVAPYAISRDLGALVLIDRVTNATAAMGVVVDRTVEAAAPLTGLRRFGETTAARALGANWRAELAPALTWRFGSAAALGLVVALLGGSWGAGVVASLADVVLRPVFRAAHRAIWAAARARNAEGDIVEGGGGI
jgi:sulfate adenylyltransferase large subunit